MNSIELNGLFDTETGKRIYSDALSAIKLHSMHEKIEKGILVGLSGGADSVLLLHLLLKYQIKHSFKICAVHINHMIRGAEADRDEEFSRELCRKLNVEFISFSINVPKLANEWSLGIEETARNARYSKFNDILQSRSDISYIAVAHNATDNLETVIFNMMRGAGAKGVSGIAPVRDNIIRPLIFTSKRDIIKALNEASVSFVTDSTNFETEYKRNYIRAQILPKLSVLSENPEAQVQRLSANLRSDNEFIESIALDFISENKEKQGIRMENLAKLASPVFSRVISLLQMEYTSVRPEYTHIEKLRQLVSTKGDIPFKISLPDGVTFVSDGEFAFLSTSGDFEENFEFNVDLEYGITPIPNSNNAILLSDTPLNNFSSKVYKISIQQLIDFDIIVGKLYARSKRDGDAYVYGKMTHKLKKIFNDKKISALNRKKTPIICDEQGILFVPGFPVRDGGSKNPAKVLYIALLVKIH